MALIPRYIATWTTAALAVALPVALATLPATPADARAEPRPCPKPVPVEEVREGLTGSGLTVSKGTDPEPFQVTVQGVLEDGIAPGVDMIVVEADSPALDRVGGIWAGMSGSPVYTADGRILGAIAYGFSFGPSKIGGITPAEDMVEILDRPARVRAAHAKKKVELPAPLRRDLIATGAASESQVQQGLERLPIPVGVSGVNEQRLAGATEELNERGLNVRLYRASASATGRSASPSAIAPGGNFAAAVSHGDFTLAGVGTTTMVCNGTALAFGHPFNHLGPVAMSAHTADAVTVVDDPAGTPFKLANIGGVAGTLDQDRLTAVRAQLGQRPRASAISSEVASGERSRTGSTQVNMDENVAGSTGLHLLAALDLVFDRFARPGTATVSWTATGRTASGQPWALTRSNRYASSEDITFEASGEVSQQLATITTNRFEAVELTGVELTATVDPTFARYTVDTVSARMGGRWVEVGPDTPIDATAGQTLDLRVDLTAYRAPSRTVRFQIEVPGDRAGSSGELSVSGGHVAYPGPSPVCVFQPRLCADPDVRAGSFSELVTGLQETPRNDDLLVALDLGPVEGGPSEPATIDRSKRLDQVVGGERFIPVTVS